MEAFSENGPGQSELAQLLELLGPLRQQRQARAERAQEQAQKELNARLDHIENTRGVLTRAQHTHRQQRHNLVREHQNRSISFNQLEHWHEKEQQVLDRLAHIRQDITRQQRCIAEQREQVEHLQQQSKSARRAVEKLACISEAINGEG
jgi:predicted  nucleic acid-binding Zn-ribbon protein